MSACKPILVKLRCACALLLIAAALLAADCRTASAQESAASASSAVPGANLLDLDDWSLKEPMVGDALSDKKREIGPAGESGPVLRIVINKRGARIDDIAAYQDIKPAIAANHLLRFHFWARSATDRYVTHMLRAVIQSNNAPYQPYLTGPVVQLDDMWREYAFSIDTPEIPAGTARVSFQVGAETQSIFGFVTTGVVEITGIEVEDLGIDRTISQGDAALKPGAIQARIKQFRMADLTVRVLNHRGQPVPNARVAVQQTRHAFLFGCNLFDLQIAPSNSGATPSWRQQGYQSRFADLFNYAVLPIYWDKYEPTQGQTNLNQTIALAQWCQSKGIIAEAHPLVWHSSYPEWAPLTSDGARPAIRKRISDVIDNLSDLIPYYDVINDATVAPQAQPRNGESVWIINDGPAAVAAAVLGWARDEERAQSGAHGQLIVNDDDSDAAYQLYKSLQNSSSMPDVIGVQTPMTSVPWPLVRVWKTCERFGQFGVPVQLTQTTIPSNIAPNADAFIPGDAPALDASPTAQGEAAQADYVARFYALAFSHPAVRGITWWDFTDQDSDNGEPGGLLRDDMSPKPAYDRLLSLIKHRWWTRAAGATNAKGRYTVHAFYGGYTIRVTDAHGRSVTTHAFTPEATGPKVVTVTLP